MTLDIFKRLVAYLEPLGFLAIAAYGMYGQTGPSSNAYIPNRRISCSARDRDLPNPA